MHCPTSLCSLPGHPSLPPNPGQPLISLVVSTVSPFPEGHRAGITQHLPCHLVTCTETPPRPPMAWRPVVTTDRSPMKGVLVFPALTVRGGAALNASCSLREGALSGSSGKTPRSSVAGPAGSVGFFPVTAPARTLTSHECEFLLLHVPVCFGDVGIPGLSCERWCWMTIKNTCSEPTKQDTKVCP